MVDITGGDVTGEGRGINRIASATVASVLRFGNREYSVALRLTREEFRRWAEHHTERYERIAGEPVAMSPKRAMHARLKTRVWQALDRAVRAGNLDCEAFGDGITIEVAEIYDGITQDSVSNPPEGPA